MRSDNVMKDTDSRPAIVLRDVRKEFAIPHERKTTLFENLVGAFSPSTYERFVALSDVNLVIKRGESVGIIGDNGSGKSTLLKIIAKILRPTSGSVEVNGKITPFLELGVGFQPDLTAKENIEVYSTILGLSGREIAANLDSVLDFAGLTKFKDTKLKNFSSGMQVRLAFATAIQTKPEILLIDEVLAVGDKDFQQKCLDIFQKYKDEGVTIIFVSHDLNSVRKFCDKALLLRNGRTIAYGDLHNVIDTYIYRNDERKEMRPAHADHGQVPDTPVPTIENKKPSRWGNKKVEITGVAFMDKYGQENTQFSSGDPMAIRIHYTIHEDVDGLNFGLIIYNEADIYCYGTTTTFKGYRPNVTKGSNVIDLTINRLPLFDGRYFVTVAAISSAQETFDYQDRMYSFVVHKDTQDLGLVNIECQWTEPDKNE